MSDGKRLQRRRKRLWEKNPRCHWCGRMTVFIDRTNGQKHPRNPLEATIDHLRTRYDKRIVTARQEMTVLSCWECNNRRGQEREKLVPLEELHRKAKNGQPRKKVKVNDDSQR